MGLATFFKSRKDILWYLVGIPVFLVCDSRGRIITGGISNFGVYLVFFLFDLSYFLATAYIFLPKIHRLFPGRGKYDLLIIIPLLGYTLIELIINNALHIFLDHKLLIRVTSDDFWASLSRSLLLSSYAFVLWHNKYQKLKEEELRQERSQKEAAERYALQMENNHLKAQLDAHLWNNSLTSLYMRTLGQAPELAASQKLLIDITAYSLKTSREDGLVELGTDIQATQDYIALYELIGKGKEQHINVRVSVQEMQHVLIPPKLMMNFIDNIFKYGDLCHADAPAQILISAANGQVYLYTWNKKFNREAPGKGHGTGLENTKKRLNNLLPGRHQLCIHETDNDFSISLKLLL